MRRREVGSHQVLLMSTSILHVRQSLVLGLGTSGVGASAGRPLPGSKLGEVGSMPTSFTFTNVVPSLHSIAPPHLDEGLHLEPFA